MKLDERRNLIVQLVEQKGFLSVQELCQLCSTSIVTIRRDLIHLDAQNRLRRTHGGAAAVNTSARVVEETADLPERSFAERRYAKPRAVEAAHVEQPLLDRLDALVTADFLPKLPNLIQKTSKKRHIPVIAESQPIPDTETCVMVDNYQAGFDLGCWAGQYALDHWKGRAALLDLTYHRPNTQARSQGFLDGLRSVEPEAELVFSINTQARYDMAYQLAHDALSVHPNINMIFAVNDTGARGAYDACKDLHIPPGQLIILTFGVEGPTMIELLLKDEWIQAGVCMFPEIVGTVCIEAAVAACSHQPLPSQLITPYCIATPATLPDIYEKTPAGWRPHWERIPCPLPLPLPVQTDPPRKDRPLPARLGFIFTFVEHDWYKSMTQTMQEYSARLGIQLEVLDFEQTLKDELNLRRIEIARRAAHEVKPGDTIFIDSGPIARDLAEQLCDHSGITVITNAMPVLETLKDRQGSITLISTGGDYQRGSQSFVGPTAENMLKELRIDKLFLMVSGVSRSFGISHTNISEVTIKQLMLQTAREVILLADYACFQQEALIQVAPISVVNKIITDDALPPSIRLELGAMGIAVILATM